MIVKKITSGFVVQTFDGDKCISQEFIVGFDVDIEREDGEPIDQNVTLEYHPFDMVQPTQE